MTLSHLTRKAAKAECRFLTRALITAFPIMLLILPLLWLTGYPPEEWPYVSGIFTLSMIGSGTLTGCTTTLAARWAHRYAGSVAARLGIEIEQPKDQNPRPGHGRTTRLGARTLRTMASWGLAIHILALVTTQTGMPPIETRFAPTILATGAAGLMSITGGLAGLAYAMERHPAIARRFPGQLRNWTVIAGRMI